MAPENEGCLSVRAHFSFPLKEFHRGKSTSFRRDDLGLNACLKKMRIRLLILIYSVWLPTIIPYPCCKDMDAGVIFGYI